MSKRQLFLLIAVASVLFVALTGCDETDELSPVLTRVEANIECGYAPMDVQFVAIASGGNPVADPTGGNAFLNFDWDFGDGNTGNGSVTHHRFDAPNTYEVKILVTDDDGDAVTESLFIEVRADSMIVTTTPDTTLTAMLATFNTPTLGASNGVVADAPIEGLSINEVLIINESAFDNGTGSFRPVLEIYNSSSEAIDLLGYTLALDLIDSELQYEFGNTPVVDPGEYQLVWLDGADQNTADPHTNFVVDTDFGTEASEVGDTIYLLRNNRPVDSIRLGTQQTDVSFGRTEDATTEGTLMLNAWASLCGFDTTLGDYSRFDFVWQFDDERNSVYLGRHPSHMFTRADVGTRVVSLSLFDRFSSVYRTTTLNITIQ